MCLAIRVDKTELQNLNRERAHDGFFGLGDKAAALVLKHVVLIGAGRKATPGFNCHKIALGLTSHNEIREALEAQANTLVLALLGKRDLTALEHVKDGLRKIEELMRQG